MSCFLFVSYSGLLGGAERVLLEAAGAVDGHAVLACPPGPLSQAAESQGLVTIHLPVRGLPLRGGIGRRLGAATALAGHALEVRRLGQDLEPAVLVAWGMRSGIAALLLPRGARLVFSHHDFLPSPGVAALVRRVARRALLVSVPSVAVQTDLDPSGRLADHIRVIPPGVDPSRFSNIEPPPGQHAVLLLGALAAWKRPDLALEIVARARRILPDLTLRVVGDAVTDDADDLQAQLRARASQADLKDAVTICAAAPDPRRELERAACLLHCAPAEPFGLVIVEALASGRPVVVPDSGGPQEIVDASCGELYAPGDPGDGAAALIRTLENPLRACALGDAGRARVQANFTADRMRQGFRDALLGLGRSRAPARPTEPELTLVTVSFNSAPELARLIASRDIHLPGTPIVVVDCASTDDSVAVANAADDVALIPLTENVGFGTACNRGLTAVTSRATALVNPDIQLVDGSVRELAVEALRSDRPERLLSPLVLNADGTRQQTAHPDPTSLADLVRVVIPPALLRTAWLAPWRARSPRRVGWAVGAALVARSQTLRTLGPFDESIFMYGEDMDLGLRASAAGISTWFWPRARVLHPGAHSTHQAFGGEAFERLARARQETVARRLGARRAHLDRLAQAATFATRIVLKTALRRDAARERRQLAALRSLALASRASGRDQRPRPCDAPRSWP